MVDDSEIELASAGVADFALLDRGQPRRAQKPADRGLRRADARPPPLLCPIRLGRWDSLSDDGETARRDIAPLARRRNFGAGELVAQQPRQIFDGAALHPRRDLLRQQLEQQLCHLRGLERR